MRVDCDISQCSTKLLASKTTLILCFVLIYCSSALAQQSVEADFTVFTDSEISSKIVIAQSKRPSWFKPKPKSIPKQTLQKRAASVNFPPKTKKLVNKPNVSNAAKKLHKSTTTSPAKPAQRKTVSGYKRSTPQAGQKSNLAARVRTNTLRATSNAKITKPAVSAAAKRLNTEVKSKIKKLAKRPLSVANKNDTIKTLRSKRNKPEKLPKNLSKNIHDGQQSKHIVGKNHVQGRSILANNVNPQKLLDGVHSGKYPVLRTTGRGYPVVDFGKKIGKFGNQDTQFGIVHFGKKGAHIVPANPIQY